MTSSKSRASFGRSASPAGSNARRIARRDAALRQAVAECFHLDPLESRVHLSSTNTFNPPLPAPMGSEGVDPVSVATGDFTNNGLQDIAVANDYNDTFDANTGNIGILLSNGDGTFTPAPDAPIPTGGFPQAIVSGTFDTTNNQNVDLAYTDAQTNTVQILLGNGDGTFTPAAPINLSSEGTPDQIVTGDFTGNGETDLAVVMSGDTTAIQILLGNGNGTFSVGPALNVGVNDGENDYVSNLVAGDFNNDGLTDLAFTDPVDGNVGVVFAHMDHGTLSFVTGPGSTFASGIPAGGVLAAGFFNSNQYEDLAVASGNYVSILLNQGDGSFIPGPGGPILLDATDVVGSIAAGDLNNDGITDLALGSAGVNDDISLLICNGNGTFSQPADSPISDEGRYPVSLALADFTGNGQLDIATADPETNSVGILMQGPYLGTSGAPIATVAGQIYSGPVAEFSDPTAAGAADFTAAINWGDGSPVTMGTVNSNGEGEYIVSGTHTYGANGNYAPVITVIDTNSQTISIDATAEIAPSLIGVGVPVTGVQGTAFTAVIADFSDYAATDSSGNFTATIDWGDGTADTAGTIVEVAAPGVQPDEPEIDGPYFAVSGTHTYATRGTYTATVFVTENDDDIEVKFPETIVVEPPVTTPDPTFGNQGTVTLPFTSDAVAVQTDDKALVAGSIGSSNGNYTDFALARYDTNGDLDFSSVADFGSAANATGVTELADGSILVVGTVLEHDGQQHLAVALFNSDGTLDTNFGNGGMETGPVLTLNGGSYKFCVTEDANGDILVGDQLGSNFSITRYLPNLTPDSTFGTDGNVTTVFATGDSTVTALYIQPDGKIVAAGMSGGYFAVAQYNSDGTLDSTFGDGGENTSFISGLGGVTSISSYPNTLHPDRFMVVGYLPGSTATPVLILYTPEGFRCRRFGVKGELVPPTAPSSGRPGPGSAPSTTPDLALDEIGRVFEAAGTELTRLTGIATVSALKKAGKGSSKALHPQVFSAGALSLPSAPDDSILTGAVHHSDDGFLTSPFSALT